MRIGNGIDICPNQTLWANRVTAGIAGISLALLCGVSAHALNGFTYVMPCPGCVSSTDFELAAIAQAKTVMAPGTYLLSSTVVAESAYMVVTGRLKNVGDGSANPVWVFTGVQATPVDSGGNSLATESETALQTFFSALDTNIMGVSRNYPIVLGPVGPGYPPSHIGDFLKSTDDEILIGAILDDSKILDLNSGDTVTISWNYSNGDVITAIFVYYVDQNGTPHLKFQSGTKNGKPINRDGTAKANPNTSGAGSGAASVGGFGSDGSRYNFEIIGQQWCFASTTVTQGGVALGSWAGYVPC